MRRLIVNADDFGLTRGVNRAILEAHQSGIVTSATLMANAGAFPEAAGLAASIPQLSVGCHVVLVDGIPLLPSAQVSSLLKNGQTGFLQSLGSFARYALRGRLNPDQIEAEVTAQIRKLQKSGIRVSHLDTHKHVHILPQVLSPLLRAARTCGVDFVRNPFEPVPLSRLAAHPGLWKRWFEVAACHRFAGKFRDAIREAGVSTPDGTIGIVATGALDQRIMNSLLEGVPEGTWELVCHPGYNDAELDGVRTRLRESRRLELQVLQSEETKSLLARREICLISYHDLA